jgi:hypothetical protein
MSIPRHDKLQRTETIFRSVKRRKSIDRMLQQVQRKKWGRR